jgi:hypothetical protein
MLDHPPARRRYGHRKSCRRAYEDPEQARAWQMKRMRIRRAVVSRKRTYVSLYIPQDPVWRLQSIRPSAEMLRTSPKSRSRDLIHLPRSRIPSPCYGALRNSHSMPLELFLLHGNTRARTLLPRLNCQVHLCRTSYVAKSRLAHSIHNA